MRDEKRKKRRGGHNKIDLTGKVFGKLTVLYDTGERKRKRVIWKCRCECGNECNILGRYLVCGDTKSCGCLTKGNAHNRTGHGNVGGSYWYHVQSNATNRRGIPFSITVEYIDALFIKQCAKCALTGVPIDIVDNYRDDYLKQTASLDRIDNSKGYVPGNVQWVHKIINIMRNKLDINEFKNWCKLVYLHNKETKL